MDNFWTDTPFGITLLASLTLTMMGSIVLSNVVRFRTHAQLANAAAWPKLAMCLFGYFVIITIETYLAIVVYYLAGSMMGMLHTFLPFIAVFGTPVWLVMQIIVVGAWLSAAFVIFRHMFQPWL